MKITYVVAHVPFDESYPPNGTILVAGHGIFEISSVMASHKKGGYTINAKLLREHCAKCDGYGYITTLSADGDVQRPCCKVCNAGAGALET